MKTDLRLATAIEIRDVTSGIIVSCGREEHVIAELLKTAILCFVSLLTSDINVDNNLLGEVWLIHS